MDRKCDRLLAGHQRRLLAVGLVVMTAVLAMADANAARGGGRAGGRMAQSSVSGASRAHAGAGGASRASAGNVNRGGVNRGNVNRGNVSTGNVNRGNVNTGNINRGNVNVGNDVNIDIDGGYGHGYYHHPIAAGVAIGAVAVTTAAVLGSYYRTLPPGCTVVVKGGVSYHYCGSVYYQQTWSGNDVVYVVVNP